MEALTEFISEVSQLLDGERLHRIELPDSPETVVERWQGSERLSDGVDYWVDVLSTDADLPIEDWLAQPATLYTRDASGNELARTGLVNEASLLDSDGGLARYRVRLVGWTWWLSQGRHSRVFQQQSVIEIVEAVFAPYAAMASWRWSDEVSDFLSSVRPRGYCVQYRESDMDFVARLLAEEGLGWSIERDEDAPAGHGLVIFSDSSALAQDATAASDGAVRYHRASATEASDSLLALGQARQLGSTRLTLLSDSYQSRQATTSQLSLSGGGESSEREIYDPAGQYAFADADEADRYAGLMAEAAEARWYRWLGRGSVRSFTAGTWFEVSQWPGSEAPTLLLTEVTHAAVNNLPADMRASLQTALAAAPAPAKVDAVVWEQAEAVGYANAFQAVERERQWRPVLADETGMRLNPRPTAPGYQSAIVVGTDAATTASGQQEVYADAQGRIRVKFHFQDGSDGAHDSTWLRVAQRYAGPGVGSQFLPRIGQEVLVGFLDGDIDRPVVLGALYNGRGEAGTAPTPGGTAVESDTSVYAQATDGTNSAQANLAGGHAPAWHAAASDEQAHRNAGALWGMKSKEWGGSGYSQLVFDDSDEQLRVQLATTQAYSQLNLGHLVHQADNYRGSLRGTGFELRTDAWGTVRATSGLWLSAYGQQTDAPAGEAVQPAALLNQLQSLGKTFSQAASTHLTAKLAAHEGVRSSNASELISDQSPLKAILTSASTTVSGTDYDSAKSQASEHATSGGTDKVPHMGDALLGLAAPQGIGMVAGQGLAWSVGETLTLASGQHSETAVAGNARLHSGQAIGVLAAAVEGSQAETTSLSVVSGEGALDVQAQSDAIRVQSKEALQVITANAQLELAAGKTIKLATAGGASITIEGGNISVACPGTITVHAGKKSFVGPAHLSREMNSWPSTSFDERVQITLRDGKTPAANHRYEYVRADGAKIQGVTDGDGWADLQKGLGSEGLSIRLLGKAGS